MSERLFHLIDEREGADYFFIPYFVVSHKVVRVYRFPFCPFFDSSEWAIDIEVSVVVGELFTGMDVSDSYFKVVRSAEAVSVEAVVYVTGVIPAEYEVSFVVSKAVSIEDFLVSGVECIELFRSEFAIEFIENPGDSSFRDEFTRHDTVAHFGANEA